MFKKIPFLLLVSAFFLLLVLVPWYDFRSDGIDLSRSSLSFSVMHPLGTDHLGRDLVARISHAIHYTIPFLWGGVTIGLLLGWIAGTLICLLEELFPDTPVLPVIDQLLLLLSGIPIFLVVFSLSIWLLDMGINIISASLLCLFFLNGCNRIRVLYLQSSTLGYWKAHKAYGGKLGARILQYGFLCSWWPFLLVQWFQGLNASVVAEVSLSYLGFGVQEPNPSLGNILSSHFSDYLHGDFKVLGGVLGVLAVLTIVPQAWKAWVENNVQLGFKDSSSKP